MKAAVTGRLFSALCEMAVEAIEKGKVLRRKKRGGGKFYLVSCFIPVVWIFSVLRQCLEAQGSQAALRMPDL